MKNWYVSWHSKKIYGFSASLVVVEEPWWTRLIEWLAGSICRHVTRDRWCCPPTWTFNVPLSIRKAATDTDLFSRQWRWKRSLGDALYETFSRCIFLPDRHQKVCHEVSLTDEWLKEHGFDDLLTES
jgi:hypothetical protein